MSLNIKQPITRFFLVFLGFSSRGNVLRARTTIISKGRIPYFSIAICKIGNLFYLYLKYHSFIMSLITTGQPSQPLPPHQQSSAVVAADYIFILLVALLDHFFLFGLPVCLESLPSISSNKISKQFPPFGFSPVRE